MRKKMIFLIGQEFKMIEFIFRYSYYYIKDDVYFKNFYVKIERKNNDMGI